jgi:hypothetical protein
MKVTMGKINAGGDSDDTADNDNEGRKQGKRQQNESELIIDGVAGPGGKNWMATGKKSTQYRQK